MATVIDSLVIELGLDPSKLTQGQREAIDSLRQMQEAGNKAAVDIEDRTRRVSDGFAAMKRQLFTTLGSFVAGYGASKFVETMASLDATTSRMATTMNMSSRDLSVWQGAVEQAGGKAESAAGALGGLSSEMNKFMLTGQAGMLPVLNNLNISLYDANRQLKTSGQLMLEIAGAIQGMDPARATALLSMIPGMNQDMINLLLQGRTAVEDYLRSAQRAGGITAESAKLAKDYQREMAQLDRSMTSFGRNLFTFVAPAIITVTDKLRDMFQLANQQKEGAGAGEKTAKEWGAAGAGAGTAGGAVVGGMIAGPFGVIPGAIIGGVAGYYGGAQAGAAVGGGGSVEMILARRRLAADLEARRTGAATPGAGAAVRTPVGSAGSANPSAQEQEAYIRAAAVSRGIDPEVAVAVARSEGLKNPRGDFDATGNPTSFGPFQLHYPGVGRNTADGLGSKFTKQTGLHASDMTTWRQQVDFALDEAKKGGWGPWHGWRGSPYAGIGVGAGAAVPDGRGAGTTNTTISVDKVTINTQATDAGGIAADFKSAMQRQNYAASANGGQQ